MNTLKEIMNKSSHIKIVNEHRRCDVDSSGLELPNGRDHYGLWNWYVDDKRSEWPGFYRAEDCINDMVNKLNDKNE